MILGRWIVWRVDARSARPERIGRYYRRRSARRAAAALAAREPQLAGWLYLVGDARCLTC